MHEGTRGRGKHGTDSLADQLMTEGVTREDVWRGTGDGVLGRRLVCGEEDQDLA